MFWIISTVSLIYGKFFDPMFDGFYVLLMRQLVFNRPQRMGWSKKQRKPLKLTKIDHLRT